jgi:hypothetical protein
MEKKVAYDKAALEEEIKKARLDPNQKYAKPNATTK